MADDNWWPRWRPLALLILLCWQCASGYEQMYTISQLSPKSVAADDVRLILENSQSAKLAFKLEPSSVFHDEIQDTIDHRHARVEDDDENDIYIGKSAEANLRESRSINIDEIPLSNNNEIDNELEMHNKRKYYDIHPTKAVDYLLDREDPILPSEGFGDRLDFRFPGEFDRSPKARALPLPAPSLNPTAVQPQPLFATATAPNEARQNNAEIQNIITGIVKLLNGNVNVQANSQLLNGRPGRPMNSRINNRGPPRIENAPALPAEFPEKPVTAFVPTKTPPPYPFDRPDRPPHSPHPINLPEQIVPPNSSYRPGFHRPSLPPWHRPRPRPTPGRRPPVSYKPTVTAHIDIPLDDNKEDEDILTLNDNRTDIKQDKTTTETEKEELTTVPTTTTEKETTTTEKETTTTTTTTTTEKSTTTQKEASTTEEATTHSTTEKQNPKPDKKKEIASEKEKVKEKEKDKKEDKMRNETIVEIESSMVEKVAEVSSYATPTEGLLTHAPAVASPDVSVIKTSSIDPVAKPTANPYSPYRPRPGIVLDDPDFKPQPRPRPDAAVVTARAPPPPPPGYGEIFDVTVSAVQGPGDKGGASVHIQNVQLGPDSDIIVSPVGDEGFVSINGERTYLNLFGDTPSVSPTQPQRMQQSAAPPHRAGTGVAIPADDELAGARPPPPPAHPPHAPPPSSEARPPAYRRPQPTVRIDTCIVGDDSTCDRAQNEMCRTEAGISSCHCRPGYARRTLRRDPCRRVVALVLSLRVDRMFDRKVVWDAKLADKESEPYQQLSYEGLRAIDSAFSMSPYSDDFVGGAVNSVHRGDRHNQGVFINYTILLDETPETLRSAVSAEIHKQLLGVIRRRSNNVGASALWVDSPWGSVAAPADLDECASPELNDCHRLAACANVWGGFRCSCPDTTRDAAAGDPTTRGRRCDSCQSSHCNDRGVCQYSNNQPYCKCSSGYYGSSCEVDGEVVGVALGASLAAALVIALTLAALVSWSRKWSREQKAAGGSPVFSYMAANTIKAPPVGQPPYQVSMEERMRWAHIAEAMAANHYAAESAAQTMVTRPSSAMFGGYPTLPPVPLPRTGLYMAGHHTGTLNTVSRANTAASHHNLYGYGARPASESSGSEASSRAQERDLIVPRPKSRARSMHNQTGIYYDVEYENAPEAIYGTKGIPLSTYTVSRGPPFYR